jgi:predicted ester cyclase
MKNFIYLLILFIPFMSCKQKDNQSGDNMTTEKNNNAAANEQRMAEFYAKVINAHNPAMIDSFCTSDYVEHSPFPGYSADREGLKKGFGDWMAGFPDMTATVDFVKCWGDTVLAKIHLKGTNSAMWMGAPATNKTMDVEGMDMVILRDGKATQHWGYMEEMKMMSQLGMGQGSAPTSASGGKSPR